MKQFKCVMQSLQSALHREVPKEFIEKWVDLLCTYMDKEEIDEQTVGALSDLIDADIQPIPEYIYLSPCTLEILPVAVQSTSMEAVEKLIKCLVFKVSSDDMWDFVDLYGCRCELPDWVIDNKEWSMQQLWKLIHVIATGGEKFEMFLKDLIDPTMSVEVIDQLHVLFDAGASGADLEFIKGHTYDAQQINLIYALISTDGALDWFSIVSEDTCLQELSDLQSRAAGISDASLDDIRSSFSWITRSLERELCRIGRLGPHVDKSYYDLYKYMSARFGKEGNELATELTKVFSEHK